MFTMHSITYLSTILLGLLILSSSSQAHNSKLEVAIFYEALCEGSVAFFFEELVPNYDAFKDYINLSFVPFGNGHVYETNTSKKIICQNGEDECKENMLQSCTLNYLEGRPDDQMKYTACQMKLSDRIGKKCAEEVNVSFEKVMDCMVNGFGGVYQTVNEILTKAVPAYHRTPTVTINNVNVREAETHYKAALCHALDNSPPVCQD